MNILFRYDIFFNERELEKVEIVVGETSLFFVEVVRRVLGVLGFGGRRRVVLGMKV